MVDDECVCQPGSGKLDNDSGICECPPGKIENRSFKCVEDPCNFVPLQVQNPIFSGYVDTLKGKTGDEQETGYLANSDGSYTPLTETLSNGYSLKIPVTQSTTGYMQTHIDQINKGDLNGDGLDDFEVPVKMFSPQDIIMFLKIAKNTKSNGIPQHLAFGGMVFSTGHYQLRFTGNPDDIVGIKTAKEYEEDYKKYFTVDYKNQPERALMHFIEDFIGVYGIELYRIRDNGDVELKTLKDNGKVNTDDCD